VPVVAGPLEDASAAYDRGDYTTAVRLFRPLADQRNAAAQINLGKMYHYGLGVTGDRAAAVSWYQKAADQAMPRLKFKLRGRKHER
jgi:uncharacterized protein